MNGLRVYFHQLITNVSISSIASHFLNILADSGDVVTEWIVVMGEVLDLIFQDIIDSIDYTLSFGIATRVIETCIAKPDSFIHKN